MTNYQPDKATPRSSTAECCEWLKIAEANWLVSATMKDASGMPTKWEDKNLHFAKSIREHLSIFDAMKEALEFYANASPLSLAGDISVENGIITGGSKAKAILAKIEGEK